MGRQKFDIGDRVTGNDKKASFWDRSGVIVRYVPHKGEYLVHFDDGKDEYVNTEWLDREKSAGYHRKVNPLSFGVNTNEIKTNVLYYGDSLGLLGSSWATIRRHVRRRDGVQCQICGDRFPLPFDGQLFVHHISHRAQGGTDDLKNLITLCDLCHGVIHGYYRWYGVYKMPPSERRKALHNLRGDIRENYEWFLHLPHEKRKRIQAEIWSTWGIMKAAPANR